MVVARSIRSRTAVESQSNLSSIIVDVTIVTIALSMASVLSAWSGNIFPPIKVHLSPVQRWYDARLLYQISGAHTVWHITDSVTRGQ